MIVPIILVNIIDHKQLIIASQLSLYDVSKKGLKLKNSNEKLKTSLTKLFDHKLGYLCAYIFLYINLKYTN